MHSRLRCALLVCLLLPEVSNGQRQSGEARPRAAVMRKPCPGAVIEGTVSAGRSFRRPIGGGLDFVLEASPHGWIVRVLPTFGVRPEQDYAEVTTPPFRSINPLLLTTDFGFRAQDVVGWNPRSFHYAGSAAAFAEAQRAYRATISERKATREQEAAVTRAVIRAREGQFEVLDAVLTPGTADQSTSAGLVASHFSSTAHTIRAPDNGSGGPLGQVLSLRFRVRVSDPRRSVCDASTNSASKP